MTWHTFVKLFYQPKRNISTYLLDSETGVKSDKLWSWESTDREGESTIDGFALDIGDDASAISKKNFQNKFNYSGLKQEENNE